MTKRATKSVGKVKRNAKAAAPKRPQRVSRKGAKCRHPDAVQFTGAKALWCIQCGSARYAGGTVGDPKPMRWHMPRVLDKRAARSGRKPAQAVSKTASKRTPRKVTARNLQEAREKTRSDAPRRLRKADLPRVVKIEAPEASLQ